MNGIERAIAALARAYGLLLCVAAGGFFGAHLAGLLRGGWAFAFSNDVAPNPSAMRAWGHGGWIAGAVLFFAGGISHRLKRKSKRRRDSQRKLETGTAESPGGFVATVDGRPVGILGSTVVGAIGGALLGLFLGGSFLLLWFSLTYSPFGPEDWKSSVSLERAPTDGSSRERSVVATDHPVALYLFLGPIVAAAIGLGLLAGIAAAVKKLRNVRLTRQG